MAGDVNYGVPDDGRFGYERRKNGRRDRNVTEVKERHRQWHERVWSPTNKESTCK